jgi:hypothetical protein
VQVRSHLTSIPSGATGAHRFVETVPAIGKVGTKVKILGDYRQSPGGSGQRALDGRSFPGAVVLRKPKKSKDGECNRRPFAFQ